MTEKEVVAVLSISVIGILLTTILMITISDWFGILILYFLLHILYGPIDWYLIYKLYKICRSNKI